MSCWNGSRYVDDSIIKRGKKNIHKTGLKRKTENGWMVNMSCLLVKEWPESIVEYEASWHMSSIMIPFQPGLVALQRAWGGGLGLPEIDLFLRPNCLLNITDHQSRQKKELLCAHHKKELSLNGDLFKGGLNLEAKKWVIFQPLIRTRWVAAGLIRAELVINAITCPESQNRRLNKDCLIKHSCVVFVID